MVVGVAAAIGSWAWWIVLALLVVVLSTGVYDLIQRRHSVLRNYPVLGHLRYLLESIRPEVQQYFIERNVESRPYDRDVRTIVYERAKGIHAEMSFGTGVADPRSAAGRAAHHVVRRLGRVDT